MGHPLSCLDDEEQLSRVLAALAGALRLDGVIAFDIYDVRWGEARREDKPKTWFGEEWVLISRTSVPNSRTFRRDMTMFVRSGPETWRRNDEVHDNILIDTDEIPASLARLGIRAEIRQSFGSEVLPTGLVAVVGTQTART